MICALSNTVTYRFLPSSAVQSSSSRSSRGEQGEGETPKLFGIDFDVVPSFAFSLLRTVSAFESQTTCGAEDSPFGTAWSIVTSRHDTLSSTRLCKGWRSLQALLGTMWRPSARTTDSSRVRAHEIPVNRHCCPVDCGIIHSYAL